MDNMILFAVGIFFFTSMSAIRLYNEIDHYISECSVHNFHVSRIQITIKIIYNIILDLSIITIFQRYLK